MKFSNSIIIHQPASTLFAYLADLENLPKWNYAIRETRKISSGPIAVGSTYRQFRTLPKPMEEELEIKIYEPDQRLVISGGFGYFQGVASYVLDTVEKATRLTNEIELHGSGALGPLAALTVPGIKNAVAQNLTVLKELLETQKG
jgi:Polyketide cyclase / dehydrase and lipid transport